MYKILADVTDVNKYSNSKLNTIWQCPFSYDLAYNKGVRGKQNCFAQCGSLVHETLEKYLKNDILQFEMRDYFLEHFESEVPNGVKLNLANGYKLDLTENYKSQISEFLDKFSGFEIDGKLINVLGVEVPFTLLIDINGKKTMLNGIIDVIGEDENSNLYIIDHKSKKEFSSAEEANEYARQLYLYSLYIYQKYGKYPKKLIFDMFRSNNYTIIDFKMDDLDKALNWVSDSIQYIEQEDLYLPIDFSKDLEEFRSAQLKYNDLKYSYDSNQEIKKIKDEYKKIHDSIKDKMFFCNNLCGHSDICENWRRAASEYRCILESGDSNE